LGLIILAMHLSPPAPLALPAGRVAGGVGFHALSARSDAWSSRPPVTPRARPPADIAVATFFITGEDRFLAREPRLLLTTPGFLRARSGSSSRPPRP
jgi:hypothetical protein